MKNSFIGAGIRHGYVKNADGDVFDINAIMSVEADPEQDVVEVQGDDTLKGSFASGRRESITLSANALTFDVIQAITGNAISSSATGAEIPVGTQSELNAPFVECGGITNGKDDDGTLSYLERVFHKVQFTSISITQENGSEFSVEMEGTAYYTTTNIEGAALTPGRTSTVRRRNGQYE